MKLKSLIFGAFAICAATISGCKPEGQNGFNLVVTPDTVEATVEQSTYPLTVEADCKWAATTSVEWLDITPSEGTGNATVTVSVLANPGTAREATVHFQKFDTRKVSCDVTVKQAGKPAINVPEGTGTKESPYNAVQANEVGNALADNAKTPSAVYVRGFVKKIKTVDTATDFQQYHNMTFYITVGDDLQGDDFYCYQMNYAAGTNFTDYNSLNVGDDVVICGQITKYVGSDPTKGATVETVGKGASYLVSINGVETTAGPGPEPVEAEDATVAEFLAAANPDKYYRLKGQVVGFNSQYTSFDVKDETGSVYVYSVEAASKAKYASEIADGKNITVVGKYFYYQHATDASKNKVEIKDAIIENLEDGEPAGDLNTDKISEVIAAEDNTNVVLNNVTVVATTAKSYLVKDAQGAYLFIFEDANVGTRKEGDVVTVSGVKSTYSNMAQLKTVTTSVTGSATVNHPAAEDISASFDSFTSTAVKYVKFTGTLTISSYYNVAVDGATKYVGSLVNPTQDVSAFSTVPGVTYEGYYVYTSSNKYISIVLVKAEAGSTPYLSLDPSATSVDAEAGSKEIKVTSNCAWTVASDNAAFTLSATSGNGDATVTVNYTANAGADARTANIVFTYDGGKTNKTVITQKAPGAAGDPVYTLDTADESAIGKDNAYAGAEDITVDGIVWNVTGNSTMCPWRIGGKNLDGVDREVYTKTAFTKALSQVTFHCGLVTCTINSAKLVYSTNADFSGAQEVAFTPEAMKSVDIKASFPANCYFKFVFNLNAGGSNKYLQFTKVEFYE